VILLTFDKPYLVFLGSLLGQSHNGRHADGKMVATNKVCLALLDDIPVLLEVVELVAVGGCEIGAQAAVVAGDNNTATASGLSLVDTVADLEAGLLGGIGKNVGVLVLANAAEVDNGLGREDVLYGELGGYGVCIGSNLVTHLGTSGSVLGGATGSENSLAVLEDCNGVTTGQIPKDSECTNGHRRYPCASLRQGWRRWPSGRTSGASPHRFGMSAAVSRTPSYTQCPYPKPVQCHTSVVVKYSSWSRHSYQGCPGEGSPGREARIRRKTWCR
jgi:hypothetical protein